MGQIEQAELRAPRPKRDVKAWVLLSSLALSAIAAVFSGLAWWEARQAHDWARFAASASGEAATEVRSLSDSGFGSRKPGPLERIENACKEAARNCEPAMPGLYRP